MALRTFQVPSGLFQYFVIDRIVTWTIGSSVYIHMSFYICLNLFCMHIHTGVPRFVVSPEGLKGTSLLRFCEKIIFCINFDYFSHSLSVTFFLLFFKSADSF